MVDWHSTEEVIHDAVSFQKFVHVLLGIYSWEWATSLDFDLYLLMGKRKFKWPMIFYLLNRYSLLAALVGLVVSFNVQGRIDCQPLYFFCQIMGNFSIGCSSINLSVRTMAVWRGNNYVIFPIIVLILGQWGLLLRMVQTIQAQWVDGQGCEVTNNSVTFNSIVYAYTMVLDFIIMILTGIKIQFGRGDYRSELVRLLYIDGFMYFVIAFVVNLIAVIFTILDLNPSMSIIADVPATTAATIAACRVVRRLSMFVPGQGPDIYTIPQFNLPKTGDSSVQFSNNARQETPVRVCSQSGGDNVQAEDDSPTTIKVPYNYDRDMEHEEGKSPSDTIKVDAYPYEKDIEHGVSRSPVETKIDPFPHDQDCEYGENLNSNAGPGVKFSLPE